MNSESRRRQSPARPAKIARQGAEIGRFTSDVIDRRGKRHLIVGSPGLASSSTGILSSKLDVSSPPWLSPIVRGWVPMDIHGQ